MMKSTVNKSVLLFALFGRSHGEDLATGLLSCNVGMAVSYVGSCVEYTDYSDFKEQPCVTTATECLTYQYLASSSGCTAGVEGGAAGW